VVCRLVRGHRRTCFWKEEKKLEGSAGGGGGGGVGGGGGGWGGVGGGGGGGGVGGWGVITNWGSSRVSQLKGGRGRSLLGKGNSQSGRSGSGW